VRAFVHRAGARTRNLKSNKKKGIAVAENMIVITLNQVTVALMLAKNNTKLTR